MTIASVARSALAATTAVVLFTACGPSSANIGPPSTQVHHGSTSSSGTCPALQGGTGILPDGDFSQGKDAGTQSPTWQKGQIFAPDWEVSKGNIDFAGSTAYGNGLDGLCSVDLDGYYTVGGITSSAIHTKKGAKYTVSFLMSGNGHCAPTIKKAKLSVDHQFTTYSWDTSGGYDAQNGDYLPETWTFYARKLSSLKFVSQDPKGSSCGLIIGGVSISKG